MTRPRDRSEWLLAGAVVAVLGILGLSWETTTVVQTVRQPASIGYGDDWTERGVTVALASGHEIVVPATAFTGGR